MRDPKTGAAPSGPVVSVLHPRKAVVGACVHLRLTAPFGWLARQPDAATLDYALKPGWPNPALMTSLRRANRLARGRIYRNTTVRALLASQNEGVLLAPSPAATALLLYREATPEYVEEALCMARRRRIPFVYDTDDLLLAVPADSPLAERYTAFRPFLTRWIRRADHVTVANAMLAEELAELNPSVSVLPSFIDVDLWGVSDVPRPSEAPVRIGFWGSATHVPDLALLTAGFRHLKARYGRRVCFQFMGCHDPELRALDDVTVGPYVESYADYAAATRDCRLDIALAPLVASRFNRCKSAIKFFEYSIRGACGLYADLEPYQSVVRSGENGFLIGSRPDDWIAALEQLIEDPARRCRMACQAQSDVLARHTLAQHAGRWGETYRSLPRPPRPFGPARREGARAVAGRHDHRIVGSETTS